MATSYLDAGGGREQIEIIFPLQPLLNDIHMQKTEKTAPEAKSKCGDDSGS